MPEFSVFTIKNLTTLVVIAIAALISSFTLWLLEHPVKYILYILEILLILGLYVIVWRTDLTMNFRFERKPQSLIGVMLHVLLILLPLVLIASMLGVLNVGGYVRVIVTLMLTSFLPGYALLNLTNLSSRFSVLERIVFSYALSYILTGVLTFAFALLGKMQLWDLVICVSYSVLGVISGINYLAKRQKPSLVAEHAEAKLIKKGGRPNLLLRRMETKPINGVVQRRQSFSRHRDLMILLIIAAFFGVAVLGLFPRFSFTAGMDISVLYMQSIQLIRSPNFYVSYQYLWFQLFSASFYTISNVSLAMSQTALVTLNIVAILAFYIMAKQYLEKIDNRLPILSTVFWALFSGLAWIHFVTLKISPLGVSELELLVWGSDKTYMGTTYSSGLWFWGYTPLFASLTFFFLLLYLLKRVDLKRRTHVILFSILFASCFLSHITEAVILSVFLALYAVVNSSEASRINRSLLSILLGYGIIGVIYLLLPLLINFVFTPSIIIAIAVPTLLVGVSYGLSRKLRIKFALREKARRLASPVTFMLLFLYILSLLVWFSMREDFFMIYVGEVGFVPWFFYAVTLGTTGILAIICTYYILCNLQKYSSLNFFLVFAPFAIFAGRIVSIINVTFFETGYWESRFLFFVAISLAMVAPLFLIEISQTLRQSIADLHVKRIWRSMLAVVLLSVVVVSGLSSTFLVVEYWSYIGENPYLFQPTKDELEALSFLNKTFEENPRSMVITATSTSYHMLAFAAPSRRLYKNFVFHSARNPTLVLNALSFSPIFLDKYIYLHNRDLLHLNSKYSDTYFTQHMLPKLSPIFNNSEVEIYHISKLSSPLVEASTALIVPFNQTALNNAYLYSYDLLAWQNYTVMFDLDDNIMQENALVLSFDPPKEETDNHLRNPEDYLEYVRSGGTLVVLNTNGYEFFTDILFTKENDTLSTSKIVGIGEILIPNILVSKVQVANDVKVLSQYVDYTGERVPFSIYKAINKGKIFYVNIYPFIQAQSNNNAEEHTTYSSLGDLLDIAGVDLNNSSYYKQPEINIQASFRESDHIGFVNISTTSILFPMRLDVNSLNITIGSKKSELSKVARTLILSNYDTATINVENAKISDGKGLYAKMTVKGTIKITLSGNNVTVNVKNITENDEKQTLYGDSSAQVTLLPTTVLDLYVRVPRIEIVGESSFKEIYIDDTILNWRTRTYGQNLNISGSTEFTAYISDTYTLAGNLSMEGRLTREPSILNWNEWTTVPYVITWSLILLPIFLFTFLMNYRRNYSRRRPRVASN